MRTRTNLRLVVQKADPDWEAERAREPEYRFKVPSQRKATDSDTKTFYGRTATRGPYAEE